MKYELYTLKEILESILKSFPGAAERKILNSFERADIVNLVCRKMAYSGLRGGDKTEVQTEEQTPKAD